jgi:DNA uptake protein ComE-like DNA-binding protein
MFNRLKNYLSVLFGISTVEANGLIVLFAFVILFLAAALFSPRLNQVSYDSYYSDKRMLDSILSILGEDTIYSGPVSANPDRGWRPRYFAFNPNLVTGSQLDSLGLPSFLSERLIKYRNAGGNFKIKKDLLKIYGMSTELYAKLEPFIQLPESIPVVSAREETAVASMPIAENSPEKFDINVADSLTLISIKGIGPVLTGRIIRFRSALGGFISPEQLGEIYGLQSPALENLKDQCFVQEGYSPVKIKINFAGWAELARHPYIGRGLANGIINYRESRGPYRSLDDLHLITGVNDSTLLRIRNYIEF